MTQEEPTLVKGWTPRRFHNPDSRLWRALSSIHRNLSAGYFWELTAAVFAPAAIAGTSLYKIYGSSRASGEGLGAAFYVLCGATAVWAFAVYRKVAIGAGRSLERRERRVVRSVLRDLVYGAYPDHASEVRATWFRVDKLCDVLRPFTRYEAGDSSPIPKSRAYYPRGVSYTGFAWARPERSWILECPPYAEAEGLTPRQAMEEYYMTRLGVTQPILQTISDRMLEARRVVALGVEQQGGDSIFLGVLSIDEMEDGLEPDEEELQAQVQRLHDMECAAQAYGEGGA